MLHHGIPEPETIPHRWQSIMRIIRNTSGAAEAEQRLVATMINIERGALTVDDRGAPLPAPHAPFPTYVSEPVTKRGLPVTYHLRPSVGIVFYTAGAGFQISTFVNHIQAALHKYEYDHLTTHRAVALTPCATIKKAPELEGATHVAGPRKPYKKAKAMEGLPARLLLFTPALFEEVPSHVSYRAAFTWVFMAIGAIVGKSVRNASMLNALMASALYDDAGLIKLTNNAIVHDLKPSDIAIPVIGASLQKAVDSSFALTSTVVVVTRKGAGHALELSGCVPNSDTQHNGYSVVTRAAKVVPWSALQICNQELNDLSCPVCRAPLWGDVYAIVDPRMPKDGDIDGTWSFTPFDGLGYGDSILEGRAVAVCKYCVRNLCGSMADHLQCSVVRTSVPRTHDEAFGEGTRKDLLALTRAGADGVTPVPGFPGHFIVGGAGSEFILKPMGTTTYSCTAVPQFSARPIISVPNLVSEC
jgi:hypothetical protein